MRIICVSDLHGHFPSIPDCDLLLLSGDYCPMSKHQHWWYRDKFAIWLNGLSNRMKIIGVAGNHDFIFEEYPHLLPVLNWEYLQDSGCEFNGLKFWGTPWTLRFHDWAFNADENELNQKFGLIPDDTDIIITHGPPLGYGDFSQYGKERIGSKYLYDKIVRIQPKLVVYGHNHDGYGRYQIGNTVCLNCALVNDAYKPVNSIQVIDI